MVKESPIDVLTLKGTNIENIINLLFPDNNQTELIITKDNEYMLIFGCRSFSQTKDGIECYIAHPNNRVIDNSLPTQNLPLIWCPLFTVSRRGLAHISSLNNICTINFPKEIIISYLNKYFATLFNLDIQFLIENSLFVMSSNKTHVCIALNKTITLSIAVNRSNLFSSNLCIWQQERIRPSQVHPQETEETPIQAQALDGLFDPDKDIKIEEINNL